MSTRTKVLSLVYFLIGSIVIVLQDQPSFLPGLVTKSLIIPMLMILLILSIRPFSDRVHWLMLTGLFFSWAGDVVLGFSQRNGELFIPGLVCFLLAHVMYITVFLKTPGKNSILHNRIFLVIPVLLYGTGLVYYLYDDLGGMRLPVIMYSIVILSMLLTAINRIGKVNYVSFYMVLTGAILFVVSDSAIAVNKFSHHFESSGLVIMSTYIIAQFLIITGYIKQFGDKH
jgi:uncharacterized membrane protein YhhN